MKAERAVIILSILCGVIIWVLDSLSDSLFFYKETFPNLLMLSVPMTEVVNRGITFVLLIAFGFIISRFIVRIKKSEGEARRPAAIVESSRYAIISITPDGIVRSWNPGSEEIYGYSAEEMTGTSISVLYPPENGQELVGILEKIQRGERVDRCETARVRKDGKRIAVSESVSPLKDTSNKVYGASIIAIDITVFQESEKKIDTLRREHERFMRHELKNMLIPIKGYAELLQVTVSDRMNPTQITYVTRILEGANQAIHLIDSIKKLQDIESGTCELERIEFPLDTIVHNAISDLSPMANENGVVMDCACREGGLIGLYDLNLMPGVFQNLIKNSIEHVCMCGNPEEKIVRITHYREDRNAVVKINNRGAPLPPERLATFFEKFNTDKKTKVSGTGLGTTYAYLVTVAHGGTISVESNEKDGTTVTVRFDLHPEPGPS